MRLVCLKVNHPWLHDDGLVPVRGAGNVADHVEYLSAGILPRSYCQETDWDDQEKTATC